MRPTICIPSMAASIALSATIVLGAAAVPARAQTAADAALGMANLMDGASGGVSRDELVAALEGAAEAGQPMAMWRLGVMYENGEGVEKDRVKAFSYFSQIVNDNANTPPRSLDADIVAQSFVKVGDYLSEGLPSAGIEADSARAHRFLIHAASYFGDAEAQYRVGKLYLLENELGVNPIQGARWLSLAARKGHAGAQAELGELLFNGEGVDAQPVKGLMWLTVADHHAAGTDQAPGIREALEKAKAAATPDQRTAAIAAADALGPGFGGY